MKPIDDMLLFTRVVEQGSFTAVANAMDASRSLVSKRIKQLESRLGTRLLQRTTRKLSLTEAGEAYYGYCRRVADTIEEAENRLGEIAGAPRGLLRITMPMTYGVRHVAPLVPDFMRAYPEVAVDIRVDDSFVDLVESGIDLAIRIGTLQDSTQVARRLGQTRLLVCGSPEYLDRHGRPERPEDLLQHKCMLYRQPGQRAQSWTFQVEGESVSIPVTSRVYCNNGLPLQEVARAGLGLVQLPEFMLEQDLRQGRLEIVLESFASEPIGIFVVYSSATGLPPKARVFVSFLEQRLRETQSAEADDRPEWS